MQLQHWLFLILKTAAATQSSESEKMDPGEDYVVGGVPLVEPHQSQPGPSTSTPGGLDWAGFEWVATLKIFTKVKYYPARRDGETREGCEKIFPQ